MKHLSLADPAAFTRAHSRACEPPGTILTAQGQLDAAEQSDHALPGRGAAESPAIQSNP